MYFGRPSKTRSGDGGPTYWDPTPWAISGWGGGSYSNISSTVDKVSQDHVISGEETCKAKYLERVFEKSRESIYGVEYMEVPHFEKEIQKISEGHIEKESLERQVERAQENSEGQMDREKYKESLERQMERAQENSEGQMDREKSNESSKRQMERAQEISEGQVDREKFKENSELQMERAQIFESLNSLEELKDFMLKCKRVFHYVIRDPSTSVEFFNFSVSEGFHLSVLDAMNRRNWEEVERLIMPIAVAFPGRTAVCHAFFISAAVLLSMVYQYLNGVIDRGGGKTYSSGSLEFRSTYVSIVLFQGAYVWIKFRDVYVHCTSYVNKDGVNVTRYEPRYKPRGRRNYVSVGSFEQRDYAVKVYNLVAFYYEGVLPLGNEGLLPLPDGTSHPVPPMTDEDFQRTTEEERSLDEETFKKRKVRARVKTVWNDYLDDLAMHSYLGSVGVPHGQDHAQHRPCEDGAPAEQPRDPSGAPDDGDGARGDEPPDPSGARDDGDGARGEEPRNPRGAPDGDCGDGAPGEQPPDSNGAPDGEGVPGEQPPDPSGAPDDGDGARGEEPRDPSGAPDGGCGDGAPGEQPPDSNGALDEDCWEGVPGEQPPDPHEFLHANNLMDSDYLSLQREVEELRHENKLRKLEGKHQNQLLQLQQKHRIELDQLLEEQREERNAELEGEVRLRSEGCSCKRARTSLT